MGNGSSRSKLAVMHEDGESIKDTELKESCFVFPSFNVMSANIA